MRFKLTLSILGMSVLLTQAALADSKVSNIDQKRQDELRYFVKHDCGSCHGMTLKGGLGPALLPEALLGKAKEFLITTILEGRENTAMPPWNPMLSRDDATWIVEQLQSGQITQARLAKGVQ